MAFMLGSFTNGLFSGAKSAMDMYKEYNDIKSKKELSDTLTGAMKGSGSGGAGTSTPVPPAGTAPGQATAGVPSASLTSSGDGSARSDSAMSAPNLNADPRKSFGDGSARSDAAMSAPQSASLQPAQEAVQTQPPPANPTGDVSMPVPQSATPTRAQATAPSPWMDWLTGRNPQNRAVHLTPSMGIATGPGPSSTPMSTSPGGRPVGASVSDWASNAPQYLPQQGQQPAAPQGQSAQPVGSRPPPLAGAPSPGSPSLSNQQSPMAQAIQTQYGSGGF